MYISIHIYIYILQESLGDNLFQNKKKEKCSNSFNGNSLSYKVSQILFCKENFYEQVKNKLKIGHTYEVLHYIYTEYICTIHNIKVRQRKRKILKI